jgi:hypothetical protein
MSIAKLKNSMHRRWLSCGAICMDDEKYRGIFFPTKIKLIVNLILMRIILIMDKYLRF